MKFNIIISSIKVFLRYSNINLLNKKVNSFDLILLEDKLKAISNLQYFSTLRELEYYLKLIDYLYQYIYFYI